MNLSLQREMNRWYKLKDHPVQLSLVNAVSSGVRFPLVPAGRRSGKTERFKRFLAKEAMRTPNELYFAAAPTHDQAKKIFWKDLKDFTLSSTHPKKPSESERIIFLPNNSQIHVIGLDKPQRIEGIPWTGGGIDEIADLKPEAWGNNIYPALNTVNPTRKDHRAFCWLLGVPDGLNHYYDLCQKADAGLDPDYKVFHWKSSEILPPDVIEAAKRTLSPRQFRQEYEASFETASGRIYDDYSKENHTSERIRPHEQLLWHHDFNYTPMSSGIAVRRGSDFYILDEIILESAIAKQTAIEFCEKFRNHQNKSVIVYGDPSGRDGEKHGHESDFTAIRDVLVKNGWKFEQRVKRAHPSIRNRQNAVRALILNAAGNKRLFVNPATAVYADKGLSTVQLKKGSTFLEEDSPYQHITTAIGYMVDYECPITSTPIELNMGYMK